MRRDVGSSSGFEGRTGGNRRKTVDTSLILVIQFFRVSKQFGPGRKALDEVSCEVRRGEFVFLTGRSGAGKSTLLKLIYREEIPTEGRILVDGRNVSSLPRKKIPHLRRQIGVVFQDARLIARKTVFENVSFMPRILGVKTSDQRRLTAEMLDRLGLLRLQGAYPAELSGGEQQRVAIARALITQPRILLADEPTGNVDPELSAEIMRQFLAIQRQGTTVLLATHDVHLIDRIGGRVLVLDRGRMVHDETVLGADRAARPAPVPDPSEAPEMPVRGET